ncbi:hypothetical protein SapgrDRAFT_1405 [Saprospira grandis DSM 2844]|uniref:DUF4266 domain-containing protein n=1 Tax=Saprospira grandis DSM 2844 TaxID=694433 RepID=J0XVU7_9BACT|nr:DUF4266 domain-containing protein [Saprospira grandis]EJF53121.1 hypothetical protein SapgrDRAFT_1405 [Saprospira grandis DSM 2844]
MRNKLLLLLTLAGLVSSCQSVKAYQQMQLRQAQMELSPKKEQSFETNFQSYREGASGANSGKTGGGCGCN